MIWFVPVAVLGYAYYINKFRPDLADKPIFGPFQIFGPPAPVKGQTVSPEIDTVARTIWGEARGQGYSGMQAVANVIVNRVNTVNKNPLYIVRWGSGFIGVCKHPWQFSAWNKNDPNYQKLTTVTAADAQFAVALEIAKKAVAGTLPDIIKGATYYHTTSVNPSWAKGASPVVVAYNHKFYQTSQIA